jgi:hypothetical protein
MTTNNTEQNANSSDWIRTVGWKWTILLIAVALWLISPMFTSVYPEGNFAAISYLAVAAHSGNLIDNPGYASMAGPLYLLRLGVSLLLQLLQAISGSTGDWQFRVLMIVSLVTIASATCVIARRWAKVAIPASAAALLLTPGPIESSFIFNDNLISTAFVMVGLTLIAPDRRWWVYVIAGGFIGFAVLCRMDALLLLPVAVGLVWISASRWSETLIPGIALTLGIVSTIVIGYWAGAHATIFDALAVAKAYQEFVLITSANSVAGYYPSMLKNPIFFFGLPMLLLLPLGIVGNYRNNGFKWNIVFVAFPILFFLVVFPKVLVPRHYLLLLTPFIGIHGGRAVEILIAALRRDAEPRRRMIALLGTVVCLMILILPPIVTIADGPKCIIGRLWSPLLWFHWQRSMSSGLDKMEQIVATANQHRRTLVVSTGYNDTNYLHLRLAQNGFLLSPDHNPLPGCGDHFDVYRRDGHELISIRKWNPKMIGQGVPRDYVIATKIEAALRCQALFASERFYFTGSGDLDIIENLSDALAKNRASLNALYGILLDRPDLPPEWEYYDNIGLSHFLTNLRIRPKQFLIRVVEFDREHLQRLAEKVENMVNSYRSDAQGSKPLPDYQELFPDQKLLWQWKPSGN